MWLIKSPGLILYMDAAKVGMHFFKKNPHDLMLRVFILLIVLFLSHFYQFGFYFPIHSFFLFNVPSSFFEMAGDHDYYWVCNERVLNVKKCDGKSLSPALIGKSL